ncbi:MAG: hypothetical protein MR646_03555 [Agathobacter sp.]|nr:hypothetical protein [Agathobacter sp.]
MSKGQRTKKQAGLIVSYYLSRCDMKAVRALGYKSFTEAFHEIGNILNENPNNIKNMRDEFDPYFDNGRKGWYQRELRASRQEVFDEMAHYTDEQIEILVKEILHMANGDLNMENIDILKDLRALIRQSTIHYNQDFMWQDIELTREFKDAYEEYLDKNKAKIEYNTATSVITTSTARNIFVPNQWFVMASYAVGVYNELQRYKTYFEKVSEMQHQRVDVYARTLRDQPHTVDKAAFISTGNKVLQVDVESGYNAKKAVDRLWRFATDYSWWSGQKTVDRGDFYYSVVLNMLNLVNASQGYVAEIVNAYGSSPKLLALTKELSSFTANLEGRTYDIPIVAEDTQDYDVDSVEHPISSIPTRHRISISANSIKKIGGK